jgi:hypothetical protein
MMTREEVDAWFAEPHDPNARETFVGNLATYERMIALLEAKLATKPEDGWRISLALDQFRFVHDLQKLALESFDKREGV